MKYRWNRIGTFEEYTTQRKDGRNEAMRERIMKNKLKRGTIRIRMNTKESYNNHAQVAFVGCSILVKVTVPSPLYLAVYASSLG